MSDNILQKSLAVTYEDFLKGVFVKKSKPEWVALTTLFSEIVTGRSTLVVDVREPRKSRKTAVLPTLGFPEIKSKPDFEQPENDFQPMFSGV